MAEQQLGAGIIGTVHSHAVGHLRTIIESPHYRLVAVAEPNPELLAKAKAGGRWEGVTWVSPRCASC